MCWPLAPPEELSSDDGFELFGASETATAGEPASSSTGVNPTAATAEDNSKKNIHDRLFDSAKDFDSLVG
eukprot:5820945-Alexandrium_andersonii.AAC.1